jgi:hypothetical protein
MMPLKQGKILVPSHSIVSKSPKNVFLLGLFRVRFRKIVVAQ